MEILFILLVGLLGLPALWVLHVWLSGRRFTIFEAPGGFWSNIKNELAIDLISFGEANILGLRPGVLWGQVGTVGGGDVIDETFKAENTFASAQYYFAEVSGDNQVDICDAAADIPIGIIQNKPAAGQSAIVRVFGRSKVSSDEALTAGWLVGPAADGQADRKIPATDVSEYYGAIVLRGSSAAAEMAEVMVGATPSRAVTGN